MGQAMGARCFLFSDVTNIVSSRTDRTAALGPEWNVVVAVAIPDTLLPQWNLNPWSQYLCILKYLYHLHLQDVQSASVRP
jgi:hypothetical protein